MSYLLAMQLHLSQNLIKQKKHVLLKVELNEKLCSHIKDIINIRW